MLDVATWFAYQILQSKLTRLAIIVTQQIEIPAPVRKGKESSRASGETSQAPIGATAVIVLGDGSCIWGHGVGATGASVGEVCFNTSITGYQEIMTDPSYAGQIISFTFPHIGNVGINIEDIETITPAARGCILRAEITDPASWRATEHFNDWLISNNLVGIAGVDTRRLTRLIRDNGAPNGVVCHAPDEKFDIPALIEQANSWPGLEGMDLAIEVTCKQSYGWDESTWTLGEGFSKLEAPKYNVVAFDYGIKRNILRCLAAAGCNVTVVPADTSAEVVLKLNPDGIFLSNGPGDPAATGVYAVPVLQALLKTGKPIFGICLGHQLLARALGCETAKMHQGHRGGNQPVKDLVTGRVEITSQNHGFAVDAKSLPDGVVESHVSLFDGSNEGIRLEGHPVFSVQYHPEASPGPTDSHYLFERFTKLMDEVKS